jgi:RNA polymerase sigma-70 factor (ECF subfamily)
MDTPATRKRREIGQVIRDHQAGVWRYLRVLGCDLPLADDLTQETFLAVLQRPFQDIHPAATSAYLRKVARNLFLAEQRKRNRQVELTAIEEIDAVWERWAGRDEGESLLSALQDCLKKLTDRARAALELRYAKDQSREEIAAALQLSPDGAKNLMQRAKQSLRECVERKLKAQ